MKFTIDKTKFSTAIVNAIQSSSLPRLKHSAGRHTDKPEKQSADSHRLRPGQRHKNNGTCTVS